MRMQAIKRSISSKFMLAVLATTCAALLVSGASMLAYDIQVFRNNWVNDLETQSAILAKVSIAALEFADTKVAQENLTQLQARPSVLAAAIYTPDGAVFASYLRDPASGPALPPRPQVGGHVIDGSRITMFKPIRQNGELLGTVYLDAQYPLAKRVTRYVSILIAVMAGSLLVAGLVSTWLQRAITRPIVALTDVAHQVVRRRDFSMRVNKSTDDEVGILVDAFNGMLAEVGERAQALEASNRALQHEIEERHAAEESLLQLNSTLEERVAERTTELETAHEQLRQSQKMEAIGQLTGGVAHDFNNVLQVITGNLQLLQASVGHDPRARRRLDTASFATDRGAKLASHLLAFARRQPLQPLPTNLGRVLRGMDDLLRRSLGESVQIETVVAGGLWNTLVDPNQLENVILNLAINARDAMKGEGKLTLELGNATLDDQYASGQIDVVAGQYVMLAISDTGSGMPQSVIDRAFEPFFTTKREGEGTGLGLSMAYGFVKQSNGHIKIYSEVGHGTTIRIYLPHSFQREVEMTESEPEQIEGGTETILVVEDDEAVRATAVDILSGLGYRIITACDGENALQKLAEASHIDLLFTDVVMPGSLRSPELAKKAKEIFPDIDVLFTSGYTQNAIVHGGRLDPGVLLISKPYRKEELARKIRGILNSKLNPKAIVPQPEPALVAHPDARIVAHPDGEIVPPAPGSLDILVVEDDPDSQMLVCELLDLLGHRAHGVLSAEEAITALSGARFDVLFTDITLPGMSGVQLARHVVEQSPDTKIIFSSGYGAVSPDDFKGASVCLPKPYDFDALQQVLTNLAASTSVR